MVKALVAEEPIARLLLYRFLAHAYTYPQAALLEVLFADDTWDAMRAANDTLGLGVGRTIGDMRASVSQHAGGGEALLADLQIEHTYLFINAVPHVPAPPYESAYTGRGLLMGEPVSQVLRAYREAGLVMRQDYDALPDHIAAEVEFMSYLVRQEAEANRSGNDAEVVMWQSRQQDFLMEHLLRWSPSFLKRVTASARRPFYHLLALLTETMLRAEAQRLDVAAPT